MNRTDLPDAALEALTNGTAWEYEPEGVATDGMEWPNRCDTGWYRTWTFTGLRVEDGKVFYTTWSLDECGDFEFCDETETVADINKELEGNAAAWEEYRQFVVETGTDPLGNYYAKSEVEKEETWQFRAQQSIPGMVLHYVRRDGRGPKLTDDEIPLHVRQFLALRSLRPGLDYMHDFKSPEDIQDRARGVTWQRAPSLQVLGRFAIKAKTPRRSTAVARDLRRAARRAP